MSSGHTGDLATQDIQEKVEKIWNDVLAVRVGEENATFFELNGESIAATRIASRVGDEIGVEIEVADIFEDDPTLAQFTRTILAKASTVSRA
ncbi:hypothetical protein Skr01_28850 [Sphaerisporangium krabiense]|uniref:Acyl carrier protein n=1 Tax=Sphaerisporangium krabiense TaxID=763782 RepID=A0A7W9DT49_9ACTN|nr:phosphopantetheine-binding protein [Sphaerisporangium krabiense]MBB5630248.1 acyl carrier protein [Sphaerisporangium krabiense]GII62800.1 hypothetical protein Skr01_28850 [Sphaerisporangium krabiense]